MTCVFCGKEMTGRKRKFCNGTCRGENSKNHKPATMAITSRVCVVCGTAFECEATSSRLFCSKKCKYRNWRESKKERLLRSPQKLCLQCGNPVTRNSMDKRKGDLQNSFCSRACANTYNYEHNPICPVCGRRHKGNTGEPCCDCKKKLAAEAALHKVCDVCGTEFIGRSAQCSDECRKEHARREAKARDKAIFDSAVRPMLCKWCGNEFVPEYGSKRRSYCSENCSQSASDDIKKARERIRKGKTTRISSDGYYYDPISLRRLWLRDGGVCQICGEKVDWKLKRAGKNGPDPMSATRDHIIPIACGGEHTWENVRLAHFKCNWERGTGGVAQLLLFG